jgi:hypothetical protein
MVWEKIEEVLEVKMSRNKAISKISSEKVLSGNAK